MDIGKVKESVLKRSVLKAIKYKGKEVVSGPGIGSDAGVLSAANNEVTVASTNTVAFNFDGMESVAIAGAVNGIAAKGAIAKGVELSILLPDGYEENDLKVMMHSLDDACKQAEVSILGGHTQVCTTVNEPVISVTAIGSCVKDQLLSIQSITPGMDIVVSKWIAMAGTEIILSKKYKELRDRFQSGFLEKAKRLGELHLVRSEALVAVNAGAAAMHDVSYGGITGALWEMASAAGVGMQVEFNKIPVRQETIEICELFGLNPYDMMSTGSLLMVTNSGNELVSNLQHQGINAVIIGRTTAGNDRVIIKNDEKSFLTPSRGDEIFKII